MPGLYRSAQKKRKQVISILGMTEESEATRLALAIANYYASVQRRVTGYGEIAKATKLGYDFNGWYIAVWKKRAFWLYAGRKQVCTGECCGIS